MNPVSPQSPQSTPADSPYAPPPWYSTPPVRCCPGRAEVQGLAHHVTQAGGGRGAVREICEFLLRAQDNYARVMAPFLE